MQVKASKDQERTKIDTNVALKVFGDELVLD